MKQLSSRWLAAALLGPMLLVIGILLFWDKPQAASSGGKGIIQVAFTGNLVNANSSGGTPLSIQQSYQRVLLNVSSVRLNPSPNLLLSEFDPRWVTIAVPSKIGLGNPVEFISTSLNFGGSLGGTQLTAATSVLQLDLTALQNLPFFFNSGKVTAQTYKQAEIVLSPKKFGTVVPLCPNALPAGEGCIPYDIKLASGNATRLRAQFLNAGGTVAGFDVADGSVQPLVINIAATVGPGPINNPDKATVTVAPVITPCSGTAVCPANGVVEGVPYNPALGIVLGTIETASPEKTSVTAELSGTNQIVATTKLQSRNCTASGAVESCTFSLNLPAEATPKSTLYDFYVAGGGAFVVRSGIAVSAQGGAPVPPTTPLGTLTVAPSGVGSIRGGVFDACVGTGKPVQAAILQLLVPDTTAGGSTCDLTGSPPAIPTNCVAVATAATDDQGRYPQPASIHLVQPFTRIPRVLPPGVDHYDLEISASGYNTTVQEVASPGGGVLNCPTAGVSGSACSFLLEHGFISGTTTLTSPDASGNTLNVLVMAEDSGTNTVENVISSIIPAGDTTGGLTIPVPDSAPSSIPPAGAIPVTDYDVFSTVQDSFGARPIKNSGHLIGTAASVGAPSACSTITIAPLSPMDCSGLGSVAGSVTDANPGTSAVRLAKDGVQIQETEPNSIGFAASPNGSFYNFCAPADSYDLLRFESSGSALIPPAEISTAPVTLTAPTAIPTPCTSVCSSPIGGTCLLCQPTTGPLL